jgi:hypothetical protein
MKPTIRMMLLLPALALCAGCSRDDLPRGHWTCPAGLTLDFVAGGTVLLGQKGGAATDSAVYALSGDTIRITTRALHDNSGAFRQEYRLLRSSAGLRLDAIALRRGNDVEEHSASAMARVSARPIDDYLFTRVEK